MRGYHVCLVALITFAALAAATPAMAQDPPLNRTPLELALHKEVRVITKDGTSRNGRLIGMTPEQIVVVGGGHRYEIPMKDVLRVDRRAPSVSVRKSTLIGLGVGLGFGTVLLATGGCTEDAGTFAFECIAYHGGIGAGAGALTALIMNHYRGSRIIFRADGKREFRLAPVVSRRFAGFSGTIRW